MQPKTTFNLFRCWGNFIWSFSLHIHKWIIFIFTLPTLSFYLFEVLIWPGCRQEDPSQAFALASVWMLLLAFGTSAILVPTIYSLSLALSDIFNLRYFFYGGRSPFELVMMVNGFLIMGLGCLIGYPIASASGKLWCTYCTMLVVARV